MLRERAVFELLAAGSASGSAPAASDAHAHAEKTKAKPVIRSQEEIAASRLMQTSSSMRKPTR